MTDTNAIFGGSGLLGEEIVRTLAERGPVRFAYYSQQEHADALVSELQGQGRDVRASRVDVRNPQAVDEFLAEAEAVTGRLSGVISANGSRFAVYPFQEAEFEEFKRVMELDVYGTFHVMKSASRLMARTGGGSIVVLLTAAIFRTAAHDGMSCIPKATVASMIRQLARDAGPLNIRCNGVAPGVVDTEKVADLSALPELTRNMVQRFSDDTPLGRLNNPNAIASLAAFLLSDVASDISGQLIGADGGYSA